MKKCVGVISYYGHLWVEHREMNFPNQTAQTAKELMAQRVPFCFNNIYIKILYADCKTSTIFGKKGACRQKTVSQLSFKDVSTKAAHYSWGKLHLMCLCGQCQHQNTLNYS